MSLMYHQHQKKVTKNFSPEFQFPILTYYPEDNGKGVASEILYHTHSKLFGCTDRRKHLSKQSQLRNVTKPLARELRPAVEAIGKTVGQRV